MKIKLKNILDGLDALGLIYNQKLPGVVAHRLSKTITVVKDEIDTFNEVRDKLLKEHGTVSEENPDQYLFENEEQRLKFEEEMSELLEKEIEINVPVLSEQDIEHIQISAAELATISWIIK